MKIQELQKKYNKVEIDILISHVLGKPKEFLYMEPGHILTSYQFNILSKLIKRRLKGEPIAYILGYKDFLGLRFKVNKNVLVPRPETELLVESILQRILNNELGIRNKQQPAVIADLIRNPRDLKGDQGDTIRILDVGTGSGCIAISLASKLKTDGTKVKVAITGSDISAKAIKLAKQNSKAIISTPYYHTTLYDSKGVKFVKSNLLKNIKGDFDIIVANLPYGWKVWKNNSSAATKGLKFEPQVALFTEENGLKLIRELLEQVSQKNVKPKLVYLEFDPRQKQELAKLIKRTLPSSKATFYKDYAKLWRFVEITLK